MFILLSSFLAIALPDGWELVSNQGGVEAAKKSVPGSPLFAFRGEAIFDESVASIAALLLADPVGPEWVDMMNISAELRRIDPYFSTWY